VSLRQLLRFNAPQAQRKTSDGNARAETTPAHSSAVHRPHTKSQAPAPSHAGTPLGPGGITIA
jgi:hypothetical protein